MARRDENAAFTCVRCGTYVEPLSNGSYRNHCPACLWSLHVDGARPGDRAAVCRGLMEPTAVVRKPKGLQLVHRCLSCGHVRPNRVATDTVQPDDFERVLALMAQAYPPP